jgi:hypothetical protein
VVQSLGNNFFGAHSCEFCTKIITYLYVNHLPCYTLLHHWFLCHIDISNLNHVGTYPDCNPDKQNKNNLTKWQITVNPPPPCLLVHQGLELLPSQNYILFNTRWITKEILQSRKKLYTVVTHHYQPQHFRFLPRLPHVQKLNKHIQIRGTASLQIS